MLQHLEEKSIIVMDNALYHSVLLENYPKANEKKSNVQKWLSEKGIEYSPLETLSELRERVKQLVLRQKYMSLTKLHWKWDMKSCVSPLIIANTTL